MRTRRSVLFAVAAAASLLSLSVTTGAAQAAATPAHPFPAHTTYQLGVMPSASASSRDAAVKKEYDSWKANYLV
jgi:hypothetical protein